MNSHELQAEASKVRYVVVVGQTPPPHHGQSIMISRMLKGEYPGIKLVHVRMAFSRDFAELKKFQLRKIVELVRIIGGIVGARFRYGAAAIYYPPSGPDLMPVLRDIVILCATRWLFRRTIFHFHAGGLTSLYSTLSTMTRVGFRLAFSSPDFAIRPSAGAPEDGAALGARHQLVVPNGIDDPWRPGREVERTKTNILFVGMLTESKGVLVLARACAELNARGISCIVEVMGRFPSPEVEALIRNQVHALDISDRFCFLGELHGQAKWDAFARAAVFCFPSYYESETFGVVLIEAMSFALPVVSTRWRGIPEVVVEGETGFLVAPRDFVATADRLELLLGDPELRQKLGAAGRRRFLERYTADSYIKGLSQVFSAATAS